MNFETETLGHLGALYANAMRLTRSEADAEDLVQETVLRAYRFRERFEPGTNAKAWLLRIQYNTFVNRYRRGQRERNAGESLRAGLGERAVGQGMVRSLLEPEGEAMRPLIAGEIGFELSKLPAEQREVLLLADVEELAYKEIAEVLSIPIGTVMSRLHRARRALRGRLLARAERGDAAEPVVLDEYRRSKEAQS
jgi:RNA polymerase sigma-70 factor (ECF subfamily)